MKDKPTSTSNTVSPSAIDLSRRSFLKTAGAAGALAGISIPHVFGQERSAVHVALIGCGGRGTGAAAQALSVTAAPTKLVAMADVFQNSRTKALTRTRASFGNQKEKFDVPPERRFIGFEATRRRWTACVPATSRSSPRRLAFRWVHFTYAIEKGLNVFMEKPVTVDGPSSRKMMALAEQAHKKNLKVGVGLMCRHCRGRHRTVTTASSTARSATSSSCAAYRDAGPAGSGFSKPKPDDVSETDVPDPASTASSGPAAGRSATSTSTTSTKGAG